MASSEISFNGLNTELKKADMLLSSIEARSISIGGKQKGIEQQFGKINEALKSIGGVFSKLGNNNILSGGKIGDIVSRVETLVSAFQKVKKIDLSETNRQLEGLKSKIESITNVMNNAPSKSKGIGSNFTNSQFLINKDEVTLLEKLKSSVSLLAVELSNLNKIKESGNVKSVEQMSFLNSSISEVTNQLNLLKRAYDGINRSLNEQQQLANGQTGVQKQITEYNRLTSEIEKLTTKKLLLSAAGESDEVLSGVDKDIKKLKEEREAYENIYKSATKLKGEMQKQAEVANGLNERESKRSEIEQNMLSLKKQLLEQTGKEPTALERTKSIERERLSTMEKMIELRDRITSNIQNGKSSGNLLVEYNDAKKKVDELTLSLEKMYSKKSTLEKSNKYSFGDSLEEMNKRNTDSVNKYNEALNRSRDAKIKDNAENKRRESIIKRLDAETKTLINTETRLKFVKNAKDTNNEAEAIDALKRARERLDKNSKDYLRTLTQLNKAEKELNESVSNKSKTFRERFDELNNSSSKLKNTVNSLAGAFGIAFGVQGLVNFTKKLVKITGEFELQRVALGAIIKDNALANEMFSTIQNMATRSPFNVGQLLSYNKQLAAYRIETNQLIPTLKKLGDVAAGVGVDMQRLILAYGQVKAANYLRGQELRQFSEAGINILGELAQKFSEEEGTIVSVGEVFERVSKRMVKFEDVNEVFDRITSKTGVFYEMQQKQALTLRGQIKNVQDVFNIAISEIGDSSKGLFIGAVKLVKGLIKNLKTVLNVATSIGLAFAGWKLAKVINIAIVEGFSGGLKKINKQLFLTIELMKTTKATMATSFASVALMAAIGVVAHLIKKHQDLQKAIEETSIKYTELGENLRGGTMFGKRTDGENIGKNWFDIYFNEKTLDDKFKRVGAMLDELRSKGIDIRYDIDRNSSDAEQKLDEFARNLEKNAKAIVEYEKAINYYSDENPKVKKHFDKLNNAYNDMLSKDAQYTSDALNEIDQAVEKKEIKLSEYQKKLLEEAKTIHEIENKTAEDYEKLRVKLNTLAWSDNLRGRDFVALHKLIDSYTTDFQDKLRVVYGDFVGFLDSNQDRLLEAAGINKIGDLNKENAYQYAIQLKNALGVAYPSMAEEMKKTLVEKVFSEKYQIDISINTLWNNETIKPTENWQKEFNRNSSKYMISALKNFNSKDVQKEQKAAWDEYFDNSNNMFQGAAAEGQKRLNKVVGSEYQTLANPFIQLLSADDNFEDVKKRLKSQYDDMGKAIESLSQKGITKEAVKKTASPFKITTDDANEAIKILKSMQSAVKSTGESIGVVFDTKKSSSVKSYTEEFKQMVEMIKTMNSEYNQLIKLFDKDKSLSKIISSFQDQFDAMPSEFRGVFKKVEEIGFDTEEHVAQSLKLLEPILENNKYKKDMKTLLVYLRKEYGKFLDSVEDNLKKEQDKHLNSMIDKMFSDYETSLSLDKINFPKSLAKELFDLDVSDLHELTNSVLEQAVKVQGTDEEAKYAEYLNKLYDMTNKHNLELAKNYSKYIKEEMSESIKIEMEYMKKRAEVMSLGFNKEQSAKIIENLDNEMKNALKKQEWDDFKKTPFYVGIFENIADSSVVSLQVMKKQLEQLLPSISQEAPELAKEVVKQIENINNQLRQTKSLEVMIADKKAWVETRDELGLKNASELNRRLSETSEYYNDMNKDMLEAQKLYKAAEKIGELQNSGDSILSKLFLSGGEETVKESIKEWENEIRDLRKKVSKDTKSGTINDSDKGRIAWLDTAIQSAYAYIEAVKILGTDKVSKDTIKELRESWEYLSKEQKNAKEALDIYMDAIQKRKNLTRSIIQFAEDWKVVTSGIKTSFDTLLEGVFSTTGKVSSATREMMSQISDSITNIATEVANITESIAKITDSAEDAGDGIEKAFGSALESKDLIGIIMSVVNILVSFIKLFASIRNTARINQIEKEKESLAKLEREYERFSEILDSTYNIDRLTKYRDLSIDNLNDQIDAYNEMIEAEKEKKSPDYSQIKEWENSVEDMYDKLKESTEKFYEEFGGWGSESAMKSAAESFVDAWFEAFKETGDGLSGLEDTFDSFLENMLKKQLLMKLSDRYFTNIFNEFDELLSREGGLSENRDELMYAIDNARTQMDGFNEEATILANALSSAMGIGGNLEDLQGAISGMSEYEAEIIAAYLNSIRMFVAENHDSVLSLVEGITIDNNTNPLLANIKIIAQNTTAISTLLDSVTIAGGHPNGGGAGFKVFVDM